MKKKIGYISIELHWESMGKLQTFIAYTKLQVGPIMLLKNFKIFDLGASLTNLGVWV
jgi:hypothetical protein